MKSNGYLKNDNSITQDSDVELEEVNPNETISKENSFISSDGEIGHNIEDKSSKFENPKQIINKWSQFSMENDISMKTDSDNLNALEKKLSKKFESVY